MRGVGVSYVRGMVLCLLLVLAGCGGGGSSAPLAPSTGSSGGTTTGSSGGSSGGGSGGSSSGASNVVSVVVNGGTGGPNTYPNVIFATVKVCEPGNTGNCLTLNNVLVDTGSSGLRLEADALPAGFINNLPPLSRNGLSYAECMPFVSTSTWGSVRSADVYLGGETAKNISLQLIGDPGFAVPANCGQGGRDTNDTSAALGANGILGIGPSAQDCGSGCALDAANGYYYLCNPLTAGSCNGAAADSSVQVVNPVSHFVADNNGVSDNNGSVLVLPAVPEPGQQQVAGSLIFGIGTRGNNALGPAVPLFLDSANNLTAMFQGSSYGSSYIDSGTSVLVVPESGIPIPACASGTAGDGFACPQRTLSLQATLAGTNRNVTVPVSVSIANATQLFTDHPDFHAFPDLALPPGSMMILGSPFFYGHSVFTSIEGQVVAGYGTQPFEAFY